GAQFLTLPYTLFEQLSVHPLTMQATEEFAKSGTGILD
ncbi:MAG: transaldolase, partial [Fibrobacteria bacterium]|nr:transaldolase [Fibrobacteria bacterium]